MKRSEFLKKLGIGLGVAVVAPTVFAEKDNFTGGITRISYPDMMGVNSKWIHTNGIFYERCKNFTPADVLSIWKQTGNLITEDAMVYMSEDSNKEWGFRQGLIFNDKTWGKTEFKLSTT